MKIFFSLSLSYLVYIVDLRIGENVELGINVIKQLNYLYWLRILANVLKIDNPTKQDRDHLKLFRLDRPLVSQLLRY